MNPGHEPMRDARLSLSGILRAGAAVGAVIALLAAVVLSRGLPDTEDAIGARDIGAAVAATPSTSAAAPALAPALEYSGAIGHYSDEPAEPAPTF